MTYLQRSRAAACAAGLMHSCVAAFAVVAAAAFRPVDGGRGNLITVGVVIVIAILVAGLDEEARSLARQVLLSSRRLTRAGTLWGSHGQARVGLLGWRKEIEGSAIPDLSAAAATTAGTSGHGWNRRRSVNGRSRRLTVTHWNSLLGVHRRSPLPHNALQRTRNSQRNEECFPRATGQHRSARSRHRLQQLAEDVPRWGTSCTTGVHHPQGQLVQLSRQ